MMVERVVLTSLAPCLSEMTITPMVAIMIAAPLSGVILSPRKISPNSATDTGSVLMKA
jgi:hypothetical protein